MNRFRKRDRRQKILNVLIINDGMLQGTFDIHLSQLPLNSLNDKDLIVDRHKFYRLAQWTD